MKTATVRELTRNWPRTLNRLRPGETLAVTNRGKQEASLTKWGQPANVRRPVDFFATAKADGVRGKAAAAIRKDFQSDEGLS